jgi:hypothetical protein
MQWPWCGDTREDRARRVALSYRRLMEMALAGQIDDPAAAFEQLDSKWLELGQHWLKPGQTPLDLDEWMTPADMAELFSIDPHDLRNWAARGHIRAIIDSSRRHLYCVGDVVEYARQRHVRRSGSMMPPG